MLFRHFIWMARKVKEMSRNSFGGDIKNGDTRLPGKNIYCFICEKRFKRHLQYLEIYKVSFFVRIRLGCIEKKWLDVWN